jgi:hypothetical protein
MLARSTALRVTIALCALAACSPTPERVQGWKATPDGRERLVETVRDGSLAVPLRAQAAGALLEVGWVDQVESAVGGTTLEDRARLIPAVAREAARSLDVADAARAWDAREVLLALRRHATTEEAARTVDAALLPALERDLRAGRLTGGRHTLKEMLTAVGSAAVPVLTRVIADQGTPVATPVELLDKLGDAATRDAGGAALVRRARTLPTVPDELWSGMSTLGGPAATAFLEEVVDKRSGQPQLRAAQALAKIRLDSGLVPYATRVAKDRSAPLPVRHQMIALLERLGNEDARKGLIELIATDPDGDLRFRAFASIIKSGNGRNLQAALEAFPGNVAYSSTELHERLVDPIAKISYAGRSEVLRSLESRSPLVRLVALWSLEKSSFASDVKFVDRLVKDRGTVRGVPATTVGAEASRVSAVLKRRAS